MLSVEVKKHDQFTVEFKVGYSHADQQLPVSDFVMNTWVFLPDSLYINHKTYSKSDFYRDLRSYIRLITPVYHLSDLTQLSCHPFDMLVTSLHQYRQIASEQNSKDLEHQLKMLGNIVRSALRARCKALVLERDTERCMSMLRDTFHELQAIQGHLRELFSEKDNHLKNLNQMDAFQKTDAYLCAIIAHYMSGIQPKLKEHHYSRKQVIQNMYASYFRTEQAYQVNRDYLCASLRDKKRNQDFLKQILRLRRFVERDLYLTVRKKNNTFLAQQILFMVAAGMSMIFATIVSFSFQQTYGNFTRPLFIALVVSYMFKDRIKDFLRYWFANKLGSKYYDYRTKLDMRGKYIGQGKEGCDFVNEGRVPEAVKKVRLRGEDEPLDLAPESVLLYRRRMILFGRRMLQQSRYAFPGVNEIIRINLKDIVRRMDNPHVEVPVFQKQGDFQQVQVERLYYLVFVVQMNHQGQVYYKRYRLELNRRGVKQIREW